jgi:hypothetical protein
MSHPSQSPSLACRPGVLRHTALFLSVVLATSGLAQAQGAPSRADVLFREGREATKKQDHALACQKFAESYALDETPGTLVNLGSCEEKLGKVSQAWRHLTDAIQQLPSTDDRIPVARGLLDGLSKKVARVTISMSNVADGAAVKLRLDGLEIPAKDRKNEQIVDPGEHVVLGHTDDGRDARVVVQAAAGQAVEAALVFPAAEAPRVAPVPSATGASAGAGGAAAPTGAPAPGRTRRIVGYTAGGLGLVGLGVGAFFGLRARSKNGDAKGICVDNPASCPRADFDRHEQLVQDGKSARNVALAGSIVGGALLTLGVVLVVTAPKAAATTGVRLQVRPDVGPQSASLSLGGAWLSRSPEASRCPSRPRSPRSPC